MALPVDAELTIPEDELALAFTPSGGPGGQHANKTSTRVELTWDVAGSRVLSPQQRALIQQRLRNRIDASGCLRLTSDAYRSQLRNREDVRRRLAELVARARRPDRPRRPTEPSATARRRRVEDKRRRGETKRLRRDPDLE